MFVVAALLIRIFLFLLLSFYWHKPRFWQLLCMWVNSKKYKKKKTSKRSRRKSSFTSR